MVRELAYSVSDREHWISAAGGLAGVLAVLWVSHALLGIHSGILAVASLGASAVLLFAAPHGALSQPWPVFGGHMISAAVGVACAQSIADPWLASAAAVALAILAMHFAHCLHPPGGAVALVAVLGGEAIRAEGYHFVLAPVGLNVLLMLVAALVINNLLPGHCYPARANSRKDHKHRHNDRFPAASGHLESDTV